jgi:ADP-ribose pyrophosphatase
MSAMKLESIEIVEDRTAKSKCDEGFLRVARMMIRNVYDDGSRSESYPCDVVSRPGSDAVVAVLYEIEGDRRIQVLLRESPRAPIYLRHTKTFVHPDPRVYRSITEVVAGLVEASDGTGEPGMRKRAAIESDEEAGCRVDEEAFTVIGGETFASPGTSDEKIYYCAGSTRLSSRRAPRGDGSVMEEHGELVIRELRDAIRACRSGEIPDMKTELALLRLADHLGYIAQLDCFEHELPPDLRDRYQRLGVSGPPAAAPSG